MAEPWYLLIANEEIGDHLGIMVCGIVADDSQELVLRRTGPYVPAVSIAGMGNLIIREAVVPLFKNLSGVKGFRKVVKEKVVRVAWEPSRGSDGLELGPNWFGEPESVIEDGEHDERLSGEIGELYEVLLEADGELSEDYDLEGRVVATLTAVPIKNLELFGAMSPGGFQCIVAKSSFVSRLTVDHRRWLQIVPIAQ
jgi:hypothetical protein